MDQQQTCEGCYKLSCSRRNQNKRCQYYQTTMSINHHKHNRVMKREPLKTKQVEEIDGRI